MSASAGSDVTVGGRKIKLSNLEKVLYPEVGFTKADVIDYYVRIAPVLLPHLRDRALTLKRYPNGVDGMFFYEKRCPKHAPAWVKTEPVWADRDEGAIDFCLCNDVATLAWLANLADLELHTSLARAATISSPTVMAFDLDPGDGADIVQCSEVALLFKEIFDKLQLQAFPKTSGSKGMQVYVPLNRPKVTYDDTKGLSKALAQLLEKQRPDLVVHQMKKSLRKNKVLVDWSQNDEHKTTVSVYSLRAKSHPTCSTPVTWKEVEKCFAKREPDLLRFETHEVLARVKKFGDLFEPVLKLKQSLPKKL